jgi:hypothetical protein
VGYHLRHLKCYVNQGDGFYPQGPLDSFPGTCFSKAQQTSFLRSFPCGRSGDIGANPKWLPRWTSWIWGNTRPWWRDMCSIWSGAHLILLRLTVWVTCRWTLYHTIWLPAIEQTDKTPHIVEHFVYILMDFDPTSKLATNKYDWRQIWNLQGLIFVVTQASDAKFSIGWPPRFYRLLAEEITICLLALCLHRGAQEKIYQKWLLTCTKTL